MSTDTPEEMATQDLLLIAETLVHWAGPPNHDETPRERRAWTLVAKIAAELGFEHSELIDEIDPAWSGPDENQD